MSLTTKNKRFVKEVPWGVYVWQTPDGEFLGDGDGNFMLVFCEENDQNAIKAITDAARHYGYPEGKAVYWSGKRPISEEEYESQLAREKAGLVPDPLDIGAIRDEERALRQQNGR
jgi:hypothetical protein